LEETFSEGELDASFLEHVPHSPPGSRRCRALDKLI